MTLRTDPRRGKAALFVLLLTFAGAAIPSAGCGHAAVPEARTVSLRMRGSPPNASVTIDDILVGPLDVVAARGVGLPPGIHRISVEANGYVPWDKAIQADDRPVQLDVVLVKIPD